LAILGGAGVVRDFRRGLRGGNLIKHMSKNVLIAIPVLLVGGTEVQTLNLVRVLAGADYQVTVCCYYEYDVAMVAQFEEAGAKVLLMKYERAKGLWHLAKGLLKIFRERKPDIVHVQYIAPGLVPVMAARLAGIKTVFATVHQPGSPYGLKAKLLLRTAASVCTAFFCNSLAVEKSWVGDSKIFNADDIKAKRKHFTIYNAVDVDKIRQITGRCDKEQMREKLQVTGKKVIGFVGRLRHEKGLDILLDAMPHVLKSHPDVALLVVGDGPDGERLKRRAEDLKLGTQVRWLGQKSPEEVYRLYGIMAVLAVPSRFEGFGLVAAEAMAAGLPVVGTNVGGLAEVVEDGVTGILVPPGDSQTLATAITELLDKHDKAKQMGEKGLQRVREMFSMEKFSQAMLAAYQLAG